MSRIDEALRQAGLAPRATERPPELPPLDVFPTSKESEAPAETAAPPPQRHDISHRPLQPPSSAGGADVRFTPAEKLVVHEGTGRTSVEQYRRIAAILHHLQAERGIKVVMVASAGVGEGKTLTAANLALTLSESYRRRVLLIDADLRRPSLSAVFQLQSARGLSEKLRGNGNEALRVLELSSSLALLPGGRPDSDPMAGLTSGKMKDIIQQASESYDWVILDTPPVALQPDASLLAAMVEATVFVIAAGMSPHADVERAIDAVGREKIVGVVLNRVDANTTGEAAYENYYPNAAASGKTNGAGQPGGGTRLGL